MEVSRNSAGPHALKVPETDAGPGPQLGRDSMSHSIYGADRVTHLKILVVSLVAATAIAGAGIAAHAVKNDTGAGMAQAQVHGPVVKAGKTVAFSSSDEMVVR